MSSAGQGRAGRAGHGGTRAGGRASNPLNSLSTALLSWPLPPLDKGERDKRDTAGHLAGHAPSHPRRAQKKGPCANGRLAQAARTASTVDGSYLRGPCTTHLVPAQPPQGSSARGMPDELRDFVDVDGLRADQGVYQCLPC